VVASAQAAGPARKDKAYVLRCRRDHDDDHVDGDRGATHMQQQARGTAAVKAARLHCSLFSPGTGKKEAKAEAKKLKEGIIERASERVLYFGLICLQ
jgi:hypothetical protein